jgi:hypothetical protein
MLAQQTADMLRSAAAFGLAFVGSSVLGYCVAWLFNRRSSPRRCCALKFDSMWPDSGVRRIHG